MLSGAFKEAQDAKKALGQQFEGAVNRATFQAERTDKAAEVQLNHLVGKCQIELETRQLLALLPEYQKRTSKLQRKLDTISDILKELGDVENWSKILHDNVLEVQQLSSRISVPQPTN